MVAVCTPLLVAIGGAIGAVLRWWGERFVESMGGSLMVAILVVNLLGCVLLGLLFTLLDRRAPKISDVDLPLDDVLGNTVGHRILAAMFVIGGLGAFTTYSSFGLEVITLFDRGEYLAAGLLLGLSLLLGPLAIGFGCMLGDRRRRWVRTRLDSRDSRSGP